MTTEATEDTHLEVRDADVRGTRAEMEAFLDGLGALALTPGDRKAALEQAVARADDLDRRARIAREAVRREIAAREEMVRRGWEYLAAFEADAARVDLVRNELRAALQAVSAGPAA